jgi:hypothetical protein
MGQLRRAERFVTVADSILRGQFSKFMITRLDGAFCAMLLWSGVATRYKRTARAAIENKRSFAAKPNLPFIFGDMIFLSSFSGLTQPWMKLPRLEGQGCRIGRPFLGLTNIAILQQARAFSKEKNCAISNLL